MDVAFEITQISAAGVRPFEFRVGALDPLSRYGLHQPLRVPLRPQPVGGFDDILERARSSQPE